ncbi:nuclear transport factor 2 family protein [Novosphingobium sp. G106]|uniref:nuclear transport factor 2 family protein n=1 Tax=Novosphingobium sp. G106 TaxID=2849500 RepID=UPI001C2D9791|nr:nuclear transport factor 2 family protein [Novosphingobium sp. G106]MBV1690999.1 nuclear transport factor 2 family protein [Novosphingobium sp. G106]
MTDAATDRAAIVAAIETYCRVQSEQDAEGWAALYAEDVFYEDPVGIRRVRGKAEVVGRIWSDIVRNQVRIWLTDEIIVCGNEALAIMACEMGPPEARRRLTPVVDQFRFDEEGRIASVRGFYNLPR